jgi:hypothetical protein
MRTGVRCRVVILRPAKQGAMHTADTVSSVGKYIRPSAGVRQQSEAARERKTPPVSGGGEVGRDDLARDSPGNPQMSFMIYGLLE